MNKEFENEKFFMPHVVEPAQPPMNIKAKNNTRGKLPPIVKLSIDITGPRLE